MSPRESCWQGRLVGGHGVASGRAVDSPYPAGTIALQRPCFAALGLDLSGFAAATLNLDFSPGEWRLQQPDHRFEQLRWTELHPPETFSFWRCRIRHLARTEGSPPWHPALIYYPHPDTKQVHHQPASVLEVLAPPLGTVTPGDRFELCLDSRRCRLIQPARLRAQLLEFLKFRVLAAQEAFFTGGAAGDAAALRPWLQQHWPQACDLSDADLQLTLEQARFLYTEG